MPPPVHSSDAGDRHGFSQEAIMGTDRAWENTTLSGWTRHHDSDAGYILLQSRLTMLSAISG